MAEEAIKQDSQNIKNINDIEELKKALLEEKRKAEEYLGDAKRARADYQNLKKRTEQERQEYLNMFNADFIKALLPIVDDMERAFTMVDPQFRDAPWVEGFRIIQRKLQDLLKARGCTEIECLGKPFDPNFHEAVGYEAGEEGIIISEQRKGYALNNKVIRASQVTVGSGISGSVDQETRGSNEKKEDMNNQN